MSDYIQDSIDEIRITSGTVPEADQLLAMAAEAQRTGTMPNLGQLAAAPATPPCHDCGKPSDRTLYMHVQVGGLFVYLCSDCLEEANLLETIYSEPCHECRGCGHAWEGWECEECSGTGTSDY